MTSFERLRQTLFAASYAYGIAEFPGGIYSVDDSPASVACAVARSAMTDGVATDVRRN